MTREHLLRFPKFEDSNGTLSIYEGNNHVPFDIKRVFTVSANQGDIRGKHAHKTCAQLLVCVSGKICVRCDDGTAIRDQILDEMSLGLQIPFGIWSQQEFLMDGSVLMVLCDHPYEEADYLRSYDLFTHFIQSSKITK